MAPRKYALGKRAIAVAETRQRIIDAAMALYQEQGITNTSMQEVARRADVAPGTVLNHFPTPDSLAEAVVAQIMADLRAPSEEMFAGLDELGERVSRLARELAGFYQRSESWYHIQQREAARPKAFAEAEGRFYQLLNRLMKRALGGLASNERAIAALMIFMSPSVFGGLRLMKMSVEEAADMVTEVLMPWLLHLTEERG